MRKTLFFLPAVLFLALTLLFGLRLGQGDAPPAQHPLMGKKLPAFTLHPFEEGGPMLESAEFQGPALINVFASWCIPCKAEQPLLLELSRKRAIPLYGIDWKDTPEDARAWLREQGNPYTAAGMDPNGAAALTLGITGVPESFVIDGDGVIIGHVAGPLTGETLLTLMPSAFGK